MADEPPPIELDAIEVLAIAAVSQDLVAGVTAGLSRRVAVPCREACAPATLVLPHLTGRNQVDADRLLERVERLDRPAGTLRVALTAEDIGHPIFTHFFGRARHGGGAAIVSAARLDPTFYGLPPDPGLTVERSVLEGLHEVGHLLGLKHCDDWGCVMRFSPNVEAIDVRGKTFCAACAAELPASLHPSFAA
jgi:archaemetzincin